MDYREVFYALRAACRPWRDIAGSGMVPAHVIEGLADDAIELAGEDSILLHATRTALLQRRPLSVLDHCVYTTVEVALTRLDERREVVDAAAFDATLLAAMHDGTNEPMYIVDLLGVFPLDVLKDATEHLERRHRDELRPEMRTRAQLLLREAIERRRLATD